MHGRGINVGEVRACVLLFQHSQHWENSSASSASSFWESSILRCCCHINISLLIHRNISRPLKNTCVHVQYIQYFIYACILSWLWHVIMRCMLIILDMDVSVHLLIKNRSRSQWLATHLPAAFWPAGCQMEAHRLQKWRPAPWGCRWYQESGWRW